MKAKTLVRNIYAVSDDYEAYVLSLQYNRKFRKVKHPKNWVEGFGSLIPKLRNADEAEQTRVLVGHFSDLRNKRFTMVDNFVASEARWYTILGRLEQIVKGGRNKYLLECCTGAMFKAVGGIDSVSYRA
jgi:hypothetical protein